ncbi:erythromycin esterase family protein [Dyadobacter sp.]|uniref:erythromycin esterase family protein n=1 Tax=Dyadobacter sp. TaxID=1914288 RepID=UPI003F724695
MPSRDEGFNVLAFESDYFALTNGWSALPRDSASSKQFLQNNLFPIWSFSEECKQLLYSYLPKTQSTSQSIHIAGIDPQMHGSFTRENLATGIKYFLSTQESYFSQNYSDYDKWIPLIDTLWIINRRTRPYIDSLMQTTFRDRLCDFGVSIDSICKTIPARSHSSAFYLALKNLRTFTSELLNIDDPASNEARDVQMADNLQWLLTFKYPNEKVIVWAANRHIMKNSEISPRRRKCI